MKELVAALEAHGMQKALFDSAGFLGIWYLSEDTLRLTLEDMGGINGFIAAYVRHRLLNELPGYDSLLEVNEVERLRRALTLMGVSTPESLEACCFRQNELVMDLIRAVERFWQDHQSRTLAGSSESGRSGSNHPKIPMILWHEAPKDGGNDAAN